MKIEYCISAGPGTLVDYGVADHVQQDYHGADAFRFRNLPRKEIIEWVQADFAAPLSLFAATCPDDCHTGQ